MRIIVTLALSLLLGAPALANGHWPRTDDVVTAHATGFHVSRADGTPQDGLPFGSPFHSTMHRLVSILGHDVSVGFPQECGEGPLVSVTIADQIHLMFQEDRLAGWSLVSESGVRTTSGLSINSPRAALNAEGSVEFFETGIGTEFGAGDLFGYISEDGSSVQGVWSGAACIFR